MPLEKGSSKKQAIAITMTRTVLVAIICALCFPAFAFDAISRYPGVSSNAHFRNYPELRLGNPAESPTYDIVVVNEPDSFHWSGTTYRLPVDSPMYHYDFVPQPNGTHVVQLALTRSKTDGFNSIYFGINDGLPANAGVDVFTALSIDLVGAWENRAEADVTSRVAIGAGAMWGGQMHWVEISPYAYNNDWCTQVNTGNPRGQPAGTCDPDGRYDRRSYFGGEMVFYTVPGKIGNFKPLVPGSGWTPYWIDWGTLFRAYPWTNPPDNWEDVHIEGVYVGLEATGDTWAYIRLKDFVTVTFD